MSGTRLLGTPAEAADALNVDAAELWEMVAAGHLTAAQDDNGHWVISQQRG